MQLSTFPLGSPAGGFTYSFDETLGTFRRTTPSFGPVFAERAVTMGRNRFNAGFSYQHTTYRSFEGQDLDGGAIKFYLRHEECCSAGSGGGTGGGGGGGGGGAGPVVTPNDTRFDPPFEGDLIEAALSMRTSTRHRRVLAELRLDRSLGCRRARSARAREARGRCAGLDPAALDVGRSAHPHLRGGQPQRDAEELPPRRLGDRSGRCRPPIAVPRAGFRRRRRGWWRRRPAADRRSEQPSGRRRPDQDVRDRLGRARPVHAARQLRLHRHLGLGSERRAARDPRWRDFVARRDQLCARPRVRRGIAADDRR